MDNVDKTESIRGHGGVKVEETGKKGKNRGKGRRNMRIDLYTKNPHA